MIVVPHPRVRAGEAHDSELQVRSPDPAPPLYRQSKCNVRQRAASFVSAPVHHEQTAGCGDLQTGERCVLWVSQSVRVRRPARTHVQSDLIIM